MSTAGTADLLVRGTVFTGLDDTARPGWVAVRDGRVAAVGHDGDGSDATAWRGRATTLHDAGDGLVCAGLHDDHTFLTATLLEEVTVDLAGTGEARDVAAALSRAAAGRPAGVPVVGTGWPGDRPVPAELTEVLTEQLGPRPVVLWDADRTAPWQNEVARARYDLPRGGLPNEALAPLFADVATDPVLVERAWSHAERELLSRGVVSVKDVVFDDHPGALPVLRDLVARGRLRLRQRLASQPVRRAHDLAFAAAATAAAVPGRLEFHGFKLMVDGTFPDRTADMLDGYADGPSLAAVDHEGLRAAAEEIAGAGFTVGLNVDGDAAARWAVDVLSGIRREFPDDRRHSLSDVSFIHPDDLARAARAGLVLEVYPQFLHLFADQDEFAAVSGVLGDRARGLNDFAAMAAAGVAVAAGTDLPLFWPSLPEALHAAVFRRFRDGGPDGGWNPPGAATVAAVLRAWTTGGAWAAGAERTAGTLQRGRRADLAVFDRDLTACGPDELRQARVALTVLDGHVVHDG
ncbi:amidohydrolase family protein [Kineococcus sp. SYSU DK001]|uniref:amidohydrolase family protein n=1 Tax=Kineococcus sp. SYSU DK001 TaxID=3383122 RepID=UPI003D7DC5B2